MATTTGLRAAELLAVIRTYRDVLRAHQGRLNRLNVYPVPDGDTGTNMALTLESVCAELDGLAEPAAMAEVCRAVAHGSLMGARGNSGVILSQVLRGISDACAAAAAGTGAVGGAGLAAALRAAATGAYAAVLRPVEGTILTVVREAADAAEAATAAGATELPAVLDAARVAAGDSLARTPELLPALAAAGVVDAGGAGFVLLLDAALHVLDDRPLPEAGAEPDAPAAPAAHAATGADGHGHPSGAVGELRYEVMYLLEAPDEAIEGFKRVWAGLGDSIVVVGGDGLWNCHIHTDDIGASIDAAVDCGRPRRIRVTDLHEQVEEERWVREAAGGADAPGAAPGAPAADVDAATGVVAVATGAGLHRILHSLGVGRVVAGGQSMNPSTAELLAAVEALDAPAVVLLPNNRNIIPVAEQVGALCSKVVRVVRTRSIAEGLAALVAYDPAEGVEANARAMGEAAAHVVAGEVTQAVRDAPSGVGPIRTGDWIGLADGAIRVVAPSVAEATCGLLDEIVGDGHEIVGLVEGEGSSPADTRRITEWLAERHPAVAVEVLHGGQPLYPYVVGVE